MAFSPLKFTKSWENSNDFPTYEPNEAQVRADLQLLHNETRDWINGLVESLNDPSAAAQLPFRPADGLTAQTVQTAIEEVYAAIRDAAAGLLVDGSVTREKLAAQLLDRTYGGKIWTSLNSPDEGCNPDSDFPVGQLWLRPGFAVDNLAADSWSLSGGTAQKASDDWLLTADGSQAYLTATQTLNGIGQAAQRVFVSLTATDLDDHLSALTLYLNGKGHNLLTGGGVLETALDANGRLEVLVQGQWPDAAAGASVRLREFAVVNADAVEAALPDYRPLRDWPALIRSLTPFTRAELERQVFLQTKPGQWVQMGYERLPVSRGGTGLQTLQLGQLLYGSGTDTACALHAGENGSFLQMADGAPCWRTRAQTLTDLHVLQYTTGTYTGTGSVSERSLTLPLKPKLLLIFSTNGLSQPTALVDGVTAKGTYPAYDENERQISYEACVSLSGDCLRFTNTLSAAAGYRDVLCRHFNESGEIYHWFAMY